jgi:uncharacterized protein YkwD
VPLRGAPLSGNGRRGGEYLVVGTGEADTLPISPAMGVLTLVRAAAALAACAVFVWAASASAAQRKPIVTTPLEHTLLAEVNAVRTEHGLRPVRLSEPLTRAAALHSNEMARVGYFAHSSADGSSFDNRIARFYPSKGWQYWSVGENLVAGTPDLDPESAVKTWMDSPPHRRTLLTPNWQEIGISAIHVAASPGVYGGDSVTVITADFGVRR